MIILKFKTINCVHLASFILVTFYTEQSNFKDQVAKKASETTKISLFFFFLMSLLSNLVPINFYST